MRKFCMDVESIRPATLDDAEQIAAIYNHYVLTSTITFEEEPVSAAEMARRISEIQAASLPWLVATRDHRITGFAYAQKWKVRAAYRYSTEVTVYVRSGLGNSGTGSRLYAQLFAALKAVGAHAVIGGVALPNEGEPASAPEVWLRAGCPLQGSGFQVQPLDRCDLLAADALIPFLGSERDRRNDCGGSGL